MKRLALAGAALALNAGAAVAQGPSPPSPPPPALAGRTVIGPDGVAAITRIVPVPEALSEPARRRLAEAPSPPGPPRTPAERRIGAAGRRERDGAAAQGLYPAVVAHATFAGRPAIVVTPPPSAGPPRPFVLINVHGGAYVVDCCSLVESIPIANLTRSTVISVDYRLAPEHPFPAGVDDVIAVYRELLKDHRSSAIAIYGTSSGATLTGEVAVKLRALGLPQPGALGVFSGVADFGLRTDGQALFTLGGLRGVPEPGRLLGDQRAYLGATDPADPIASPLRSDLRGLAPTLFLTATRDVFLGQVSLFHRAMLRAGVPVDLVVFEGLSHAFWTDPELPESREAYAIMANFFLKTLH